MNLTPFRLRLRCFLPAFVSLSILGGLELHADEAASSRAATNVPADATAAEENRFIRFVEDDSGAYLQSGIASYRNEAGVTVTLIGAVHVADATYFAQLNEIFKQHDAVLYELVGGPIKKRLEEEKAAAAQAPPFSATTPPKAPAGAAATEAQAAQRLSWLHSLHDRIQKTLNLQGQLDGVDYFAPNFVHADMSHAEFASKQQERNEGFLTLWLRAVQIQIENPQATAAAQPGLLKILEILCREDSPTELKRLVGRSFDSVESLITSMESGEGTVILTERNKVALKVLEQQITEGKKTPAIFYGAAHLPDMEERLIAMGFEKIDSSWLNAWTLPPEPVLESTQNIPPEGKKTD